MVDMPIVLVGCAGLKGGKDLPAEHREVLAQESSQETADNDRAVAGKRRAQSRSDFSLQISLRAVKGEGRSVRGEPVSGGEVSPA